MPTTITTDASTSFVTNDTVPNFLFRNNGDGTFARNGARSPASPCPTSGRPVSGMGTDFQDYDNDGWEDIHLTALSGETFPLFRNDGRGAFVETTQSSGLAALTAKSSGWCTILADIDNDGWKDIFTANSHANDRIGESEAIGWKQANSLFVNDGRGRFRDATAESGLAGAVAAHRGCGVADFNADGRLDLVVLALGARAELWQNESAPRQPLAHRPARRHQEQPRRHRRARHRRQPGAHDDDGDRLRLVVARRAAFRSRPGIRTGSRRGPVAVRHAAD